MEREGGRERGRERKVGRERGESRVVTMHRDTWAGDTRIVSRYVSPYVS